MTEQMHTPGPWETDKTRGWIYHRPAALTQFVIAVMESGTEADARLIAAAPDLLSIARRWAALDAGAWHADRYASEKAQLLADTNAAISKAEVQS